MSLVKNQFERAVNIVDFNYLWEPGASLPTLLSDTHRTYLLYYLSSSTEFSEKEIVPIGLPSDSLVALVSFKNCYDVKMGGINDEVIGHHPLWKRGLCAYGAYEIYNSSWISELQEINSHHPQYRTEYWINYKHYFFAFHDEMFECIAEDFEVLVYRGKYKEVAKLAFEKLFL